MSKSKSVNISLLSEIRTLIESAKQRVAANVNAELSLLYWNIGKRINNDVLKNERAEYGKQIVASLAEQLTKEYGKGWSKQQLKQCMWFAKIFTDERIGYTVCNQLTWSHIRTIIPIEDSLKRDFYIEMCKMEHWSVRTLRERIDSMLYERTAISKKPELTIKHDLSLLSKENKLTPDMVFKDPYFLDFLGLKNLFSENDLENAILAELQQFIIELGTDFAFLSRQKRITIDNDDYYLDLLFFHRRLKRLVAIELKLGEFKPEYKAQMEVYLRYLKKHESVAGEKAPIGLILCSGKKQELVELLELDKSGIRIAEYLTELPPKELLEEKLTKAIQLAKNKLEHIKNKSL
ncbi:MAG: PDDEXK nuclease domain-containing protein [Fibromonadaceae bacterium]|jgi:predicted nuclease of restriction endonuclease-like (RecB) superfamily|nr:PDDEXK nuclease domain-containing protein [Fibromonadaceae bacterium]